MTTQQIWNLKKCPLALSIWPVLLHLSLPAAPQSKPLVSLPEADGVAEPPAKDEVADPDPNTRAHKKSRGASTEEGPHGGRGCSGEWRADEEDEEEVVGLHGESWLY